MTTLRRLFHWCLGISKVFVFVALLLLAPLALAFWPLLLLWLIYEVKKATQCVGDQESLANHIAEEDAQDFTEAMHEMWLICKRNEIPMQFGSMEIRCLLRFAKSFVWTEQDMCLGHVEEDAS